jgi:ADP-heptose:LPS heptosyltransferase
MPIESIALASAKSFGDFVIARSVLDGVAQAARSRIRLLACSHLKALNEILPDSDRVTLVDCGEDRVPAIFDVKKCGALAAVQSALSLRRRFQRIERNENEVLAFDALGVRERFIAGRWPAICPRARGSNIYETYSRFLAEQDIPTGAPAPLRSRAARSVGIFPESRLAEKRLPAATLAVIVDRAVRAGLDATIFILDGDSSPPEGFSCSVNISRSFGSLAQAMRSVDAVISSDSLPAHLAEYLERPVFVASRAPNQYWLPHGCFTRNHWAVLNSSELAASLDKFLAELRRPTP